MTLNDDTKILTKTDTETFFQDQIFLKPKPILFFRDQIFRNRNRDFFPTPNIPKPRPIFFETETERFLPKQNFAKPKPSKKWQKFRNRNVNLRSWCRHSPGSWREGEREWTILRSFPVFELILYLQGRHEYSSKHSSSLFNKRYLCQHTRHSCFNCSIRVEMNRQQLLGVAREVQSFSSPSLNNR